MKKLLLSAAFAVPFMMSAQSTLMSEDFDSYADGDMLSVVGAANGWGEWSGGSGTTESNTVSSMYSASAPNSGRSADPNDGLWTWADVSTGTVKLRMSVYVPAGGAGGYIGLGDSGMTDQPHSISLLGDTLIVVIDWAAQAALQAPVTAGWHSIEFTIDMDNATADLMVDGVSAGSGGTSFGAANVGFGGIDFWGTSYDPFTGNQAAGEYYFDDLSVINMSVGLEETSIMGIKVSPNPSNGQFAINFNDYSFDNASMTITNMMGSVVHSEELSAVTNTTKNFNLDLNSGVYIVRVADGNNELSTRIVIK